MRTQLRRDAGIDRRLLVAAGGEGLVAPARLGEHARRRPRRRRAKIRIWLLKPRALVSPRWKNQRIFSRLGRIGDRLAAGQAEHDAAADEQHRQRGDEGRHLQDGHQHAVDEADRRPEQQAEQAPPGPMPRSRKVGANSDREDHADEPVGRADRQIEILVDDDEGHADRHDAVAGRCRAAAREARRSSRRRPD